MRLLYLTYGFPWPLTSGYLRHYFLVKELSRHHSISLLSVVGPSFEDAHAEALRPFTERVQTFRSTSKGRSAVRKVANRLHLLVGAEPAVHEMRDAVADLARERPFDAVFCGKKTIAATEPLRGVPLVADLCDATTLRIRRSFRYASPARLPLLLLEYAQTRRVEQAIVRHARHSVFISCRDRESIVNGADARTTIVPNGVDLDFWKRSSPERGRGTIVFTGAMDYRPNTDAAIHLIEAILPIVQRTVPEARVQIVGRDPTPRLVEAGRRSGVEVTGFVDDVRPYLEGATVFAAPLRFGAGVQNKVLEAMAMEVPVVASALAADGLRTEGGAVPPVDVADDPARFADLLVGKLRERDEDPRPDAESRRFVAAHFVWSRAGETLDRVLRQAVDGGRPEEAPCSPSR